MAVERRPTPRRSSLARVRPGAEALEPRRLLATIVVDSAGDADGADHGPTLSLRQAIEISNGTLPIGSLSPSQAARVTGPLGTPNTIDFAIAGAGPFTIMPASNLPAITSPAVVDGYSQAGTHPNTNGPGLARNLVLQVALDGSRIGPGGIGLDLTADGCTVRGLAIGGFQGSGLSVGDSSLVQGNLIGTDVTGTGPIPNGAGVVAKALHFNPFFGRFSRFATIGGTAAGAGNLISGNVGDGLRVGDSSQVQGNLVGTDLTGTRPIPNGGDGVGIIRDNFTGTPGLDSFSRSATIGGTAAGAGNLISGNAGSGLSIGDSSLVQGNLIGTDVTGTKPIPNGGEGVVAATQIVFKGGSLATLDTIGGTAAGAGNLISGNAGDGLTVGDSSLVQGNLIGTDITGTRPVPNGGRGISSIYKYFYFNADLSHNDTIGGTAAGAGNVISGNAGDGLSIGASNLVQGNLVGTDLTGTRPIPNGGAGISVDGYLLVPNGSNTIGGTAAGAGNVIAFNGGPGVDILPESRYPSQDNTISGNSIFADHGLGIDLGGDGVTPNNPTGSPTGPNRLQPYPVITSAASLAGGTMISGTLDAAPSTSFTLEFFANFAPDPSGFGQGQTYLGSAVATADASGHASFTFNTSLQLLGQYVTATATDPSGNTSEFARDLTVRYATTTQFFTASPLAVTTLDPVALSGNVVINSGVAYLSGTVTLHEDGRALPGGQGVYTINYNGYFSFNLPPLAAGSHVFTATYSGNGALAPSTSAPLTVVVAGVATTTTLATSAASLISGQPLTLTATVTGASAGLVPGGSVTFIDRSTVLGSATLDASGHASIVIPAPDGLDTFAAVYDGSPAYLRSVSAIAAVTSARVTPAVVLVGPSNLAPAGQALPFVAIVVPSGGVIPTGSVAFGEDGAVLATVPLDASGRATFITSTLLPGPHLISAAYLGDASDNIALSDFTAEGVLPAPVLDGPTVTSASAPSSTSVRFTFSRTLLVGPARDRANYAVVGPDGRALAIASAAYDPLDDSVTVTTRRPLRPGRAYRVSVNGVRLGRVVDVRGIALDGKHDGRPGSTFVATVRLAAQAHPTGPKLEARDHEKGL